MGNCLATTAGTSRSTAPASPYLAPPNNETNDEQLILARINEELADFRHQLKKSQELFHSINASKESFDKTKSCPEIRPPIQPVLVTMGTQTETVERVVVGPTKVPEVVDLHAVAEYLYQEDDEEEERARLQAQQEGLSVIQESEHEDQISTGSSMSESTRRRNKLVRMVVVDEDNDRSELDFLSAASSTNPSLYNSLERPLSVLKRNGDDSSTTYGSPVSSPISAYFTPSLGSSQETLTSPDGDKTPVPNDSSGRNSKQSNSFWNPMLPIDNRTPSFSTGVIPDEDKDNMKRYARDAIARSCDQAAQILSRSEWRTLGRNLDEDDYSKFKKSFGQEDDTEDNYNRLGAEGCDLDEVAERYYERFPFLVGRLFGLFDHLDKDVDSSHADAAVLDKRFEELAVAFKTDHERIELRNEINQKDYQHAKRRLAEISLGFRQSLQDQTTLLDMVSEFELHVEALDRSAMRCGRLEVEKRTYKMIELMVFYVRILKTLHSSVDQERLQAQQLLDQNNIAYPRNTAPSIEPLNNNHDKVLISKKFDDSRHSKLSIQRLLAPKPKTHSNSRIRETKRSSPGNKLTRLWNKFQPELMWPWSQDQTWNGIKRIFTLTLMLLGLFAILKHVVPVYSGGPCEGTREWGSLHHERAPRI